MSRVLFLRPPIAFALSSSTSHVCPPLGLAYVAAAARAAGHDTTCIDASGEAPFQRIAAGHGVIQVGLTTAQMLERIEHAAPQVIGISVMFSQDWPAARQLISAIKARFPQTYIVAGGEHISAVPVWCLEQCAALDACVQGEGESAIVALLDAHTAGRSPSGIGGIAYREAGRIQQAARGARAAIGSIAAPAWDLLPLEPYLAHGLSYGVNRGRTMPILASRGCPYSCTFCSSPMMWTTLWAARPVADVIAEMADAIERYRAECFDFYDLTAIVRRDWVLEFCQAIIDRGWRISWQMPAGTRSEALDRDVLTLMRQSGNQFIIYAPESGSEATLAAMNKRIRLGRMQQSIRDAVEVGMSVKLNIIMGMPGERWRDLLATTWFLIRMAWLGVEDAFAASFTPYPGSALFTEMRDAGQLPPIDDDYLRSLASISSFAHSRSYSPHLSNRSITAMRVVSMVLFYGVGFLRKPSRVLRLIRNLWRNREESRLELGLVDLKARWLGRRA
ncbi:MAG: radical SAM protein [Acidobacteriota bacterium]